MSQSSLNDWLHVEQLYYGNKLPEFVAAAKEFIAAAPQTKPHFFTMLASAQTSLGHEDDAEHTLRDGLARHADEPLCYWSLGAALARKSQGNAARRSEAIEMWQKALEKNSADNTYYELPAEMHLLSKLPISESYPPVSLQFRQMIDVLKSCGIFAEKSSEDIITLAHTDIGASIVRDDSPEDRLGEILSLDRNRYLLIDWRFDSADVLEEAASVAAWTGVAVNDVDERFVNDNLRHVRFALNGTSCQGDLREPHQLLALFNGGMRSIGSPFRFYQIDDGGSDCYEFLLLNEQEASRLAEKQLLPNIVEPQTLAPEAAGRKSEKFSQNPGAQPKGKQGSWWSKLFGG